MDVKNVGDLVTLKGFGYFDGIKRTKFGGAYGIVVGVEHDDILFDVFWIDLQRIISYTSDDIDTEYVTTTRSGNAIC